MKKFTAIFMYVWVLALLLPVWTVSMLLMLLLSVLYLILTFNWVFSEIVESVDLSLNPLAFWLEAEKELRCSVRDEFKGMR